MNLKELCKNADYADKSGILFNKDCLEVMKDIPDKSIDMILCDLPYGTTACKWDSIIPFDKLWEQYERVIKDNGAIVLFGSQPFTSSLIMSNIKLFKYEWIWLKSRAVGFNNAKNKPMGKHENIIVFSKGTCANCSPRLMKYYPQGLVVFNKIVNGIKASKTDKDGHGFDRPSKKKEHLQEFTNYPNTQLVFPNEGKTVHPTQKPVDLLEYLIRTYTNENETVLDNCMGSGSTGVACVNTNRNFIGIELDENYFNIAKERIKNTEYPI